MAKLLEVCADLEGNDLLPGLNRLHCAVAIDLNTGEVHAWRPWEIPDAVAFLGSCDLIVGHNWLDYDDRALDRLYPGWRTNPRQRVWDTLAACRVIWPADTLLASDMKLKARGLLPGHLLKSHSLKAWGCRTGDHKSDYTGGFDAFSEEMFSYMIQDGHSGKTLFKLQLKTIGWERYGVVPKPDTYVWPEDCFYETEFPVCRIIRKQEECGIGFDRPKAIQFSRELMNAKADLEEQLVAKFGSWYQGGDVVTPLKSQERKRPDLPSVTIKRFGKNGKPLKDYVGPPFESYTEGAPYQPIEMVTYSPSSRHHLGQRLKEVYGWQPKDINKDGSAKVDETVLEEIPESVLPADLRKVILHSFVISKTLAMVSTGRQSWLKHSEKDGSIHGRMITAGAISGRGTHMDPNLSQIPAGHEDGDHTPILGVEGGFGQECRELFIARAEAGFEELTGMDASALEFILLGHYLYPFDGGKFMERVCDPSRDPHSEHAALTGLTRRDTKTVGYAYIYGAGSFKIGLSLDLEDGEVEDLLRYKSLPALLSARSRMLEAMQERDGRKPPVLDDRGKARLAKGHMVKMKFENGIEGLKDLKEAITQAATSRLWLKGLDGRKLFIRKPHAALNQLLQGGGAQACKRWMHRLEQRMELEGLHWGTHQRQVVWPHDEFQKEHRKGLGDDIGKLAQETIRLTGQELGLKGEFRAEYKTGTNWRQTH